MLVQVCWLKLYQSSMTLNEDVNENLRKAWKVQGSIILLWTIKATVEFFTLVFSPCALWNPPHAQKQECEKASLGLLLWHQLSATLQSVCILFNLNGVIALHISAFYNHSQKALQNVQ